MSLTDIQTIKQTDCVGDSRITINNNFQTLVEEISTTQKLTNLALPKGTRGTIIIGDGLSVSLLGVVTLDFSTNHFQYNANKQLCLSDTVLNSTFIKTTGGTVTGPVTLTGNGSLGINTTANTTYKLDVNGPTRFRGTVFLPSHSGGALTYIDIGTGDGATYSLYNTVLYVGKGLAIKSSSGSVSIVLNSITGDVTTKGVVQTLEVKTPTITGDINTRSGDIAINKSLIVTGNGTINLSGITVNSVPPLLTDDSLRVATTKFVQTNLNIIKDDIRDIKLLYIKKDENTAVTGYITTPVPFLSGHIANKRYVDTEIEKITDLTDKLGVMNILSDFLTIRIDRHPVGVRINEGTSTTLSAKALPDNVNFMPISYQWKRNGSVVLGANTSTYNVLTSGIYTCLCSNMVSQTATSAAQVDMNYRLLLASGRPISTTLTSTTQTCVLTAEIQAGTSPFTYKWYKYTNLITGATSKTYSATTGGNYRCLVGNMVNEAYSNTATIGTEVNVEVIASANNVVQITVNSVFYTAYTISLGGQNKNAPNNVRLTFNNISVGVNTLVITSPDFLSAAINITVPSVADTTTTVAQNIVLVPIT